MTKISSLYALKTSFASLLGSTFLVLIYYAFLSTQMHAKPRPKIRRVPVPYSPPFPPALARAASIVKLKSSAGRSFVILTTVTTSQVLKVWNMACSLLAAGNHRLLMLTPDETLFNDSIPSNVRKYMYQGAAFSPSNAQGTTSLWQYKFNATAAVLAAGYDVLYVDVDVVWCTSKAPQMLADAAKGHISFQAAIDGNISNVLDHFLNAGVFYARASEESHRFFVAAAQVEAVNAHDAVNSVACRGPGVPVYVHLGSTNTHDGPPDLCVWNRMTTISVLEPKGQYPNGCTRMPRRELRTHSATQIREWCKSASVGLIHYSCYNIWSKKQAMRWHKSWFVERNRCVSPS